MNDWRLYPANERVAHSRLRGQVEGVRFVEGESRSVVCGVADLLVAPDGALDRQLIYGDQFLVLEDVDGHSFGVSSDGGFVGYVDASCLGDFKASTHLIKTRAAHFYAVRDIKTKPVLQVPFAAQLLCKNACAEFNETDQGFVPIAQTQRIGLLTDDPAAVAESFLGTPYLWGGDSFLGIDCSGLVHIAFRAADVACPRDSDLQLDDFGFHLSEDASLKTQ